MTFDPAKLAALRDKATKGPFDTLAGDLVRAIRGGQAVPIVEARLPIGDPADMPAPTVRQPIGNVLFRRNTKAARHSLGLKRAHANIELVAYLLNHLDEIIAVAGKASRTMTDPGRMLWPDDVDGHCISPRICGEFATDGQPVGRCGPCAMAQSHAAGVELSNCTRNPEVVRLHREKEDMASVIGRAMIVGDALPESWHRDARLLLDAMPRTPKERAEVGI